MTRIRTTRTTITIAISVIATAIIAGVGLLAARVINKL